MRKNFGVKSWIYPEPVLIIATYDEEGRPNAMNAAWGGISGSNQISMCLSAGHKTVENFLHTGAFSVSMADAEHVVGCDYVGLVSGNIDENKFEKAGFTAEKSENINAPIISELPMALECKVLSYNKESGILVGEIVNVSVDENVLTPEGKTDLTKFRPIVYDPVNANYLTLGDIVGHAFKEGNRLK